MTEETAGCETVGCNGNVSETRAGTDSSVPGVSAHHSGAPEVSAHVGKFGCHAMTRRLDRSAAVDVHPDQTPRRFDARGRCLGSGEGGEARKLRRLWHRLHPIAAASPLANTRVHAMQGTHAFEQDGHEVSPPGGNVVAPWAVSLHIGRGHGGGRREDGGARARRAIQSSRGCLKRRRRFQARGHRKIKIVLVPLSSIVVPVVNVVSTGRRSQHLLQAKAPLTVKAPALPCHSGVDLPLLVDSRLSPLASRLACWRNQSLIEIS